MDSGWNEKLYAIIATTVVILILAYLLPIPVAIPLLISLAVVVFFGLGFVFGSRWSDLSWRWSVWLTLPVALLVAMDLVVVIPSEVVTRDLIFLSCAIVGSALGGLIGARQKGRPAEDENEETT